MTRYNFKSHQFLPRAIGSDAGVEDGMEAFPAELKEQFHVDGA